MQKFILPKSREVVGYRSEQYSSLDGSRDLVDVFNFETTELGNTDIIDYILGHHKITHRSIVNEYVLFLYCMGFTECLWLCPRKKDVVQEYDVAPESVNKYTLNGIIISDLGKQGRLIAFQRR